MKRQGVIRVANAVLHQCSSVLEEVVAGGTGCKRTINPVLDEVLYYMQHPAMDEVADDEWPEYTVVVTVQPGEPTKWEFKRV